MTIEWKNRILQLLDRKSGNEDEEFVNLVDMAMNNCDYDTCKILMKTFVTDEDFGVQESVVSVLSSAKPEIYQKALLEELPRLLIDTPEWAEVLIEREIKYNLDTFRKSLSEVSPEIKKCLIEFLKQEFFIEQYPNLRL